MGDNILVNVNYEAYSHVVQVPSDISWQDFELLLRLTFEYESKKVQITYLDEDNEEVFINSNNELFEAFKVAFKQNNTVHVNITPIEAEPIEIVFEDAETVRADTENLIVTMETGKKQEQREKKEEQREITIDMDTLGSETTNMVLYPDTLVITKAGSVTDELAKREGWTKIPIMQDKVIQTTKSTASSANKKEDDITPIRSEKAPANQEEEYLIPTTDDCAMSDATDIVVVENLDELKETDRIVNLNTDGTPNVTLQNTSDLSANNNGLDSCYMNIGTKPKKDQAHKLEKKLQKEYYSYLSEEFGRLQVKEAQEKEEQEAQEKEVGKETGEENGVLCSESGERLPSPPHSPPAGFNAWMEKFSHEMAMNFSQTVASQTVQHILEGLNSTGIATGATSAASSVSSGTPHRSMDSATPKVYSHTGVICDCCDKTIVGIRYKCGNCEDYDLCEQCEVHDGIHDPDHVFLKIRRPTLMAGRRLADGTMKPLLKRSLYFNPEDSSKRCEDKTSKEVEKPEVKEESKTETYMEKEDSRVKKATEKLAERAHKLAVKFQKYEEKLLRKQEKHEQKLLKQVERAAARKDRQQQMQESLKDNDGSKTREEGLKRRADTQKNKLPPKKEKLDVPQFKMIERMDAEFLEDVSFPDGAHVQPGTKIIKKWRMRNTGAHAWNQFTKLKHLWGGMEPACAEVDVDRVEAWQEGILSVQLTAPTLPGVYQSHWRLSHYGLYFGHRIWCHINVDPKEILEHKEDAVTSVLHVQEEDQSSQEDCVMVENIEDDNKDCEIVNVVPTNESCDLPVRLTLAEAREKNIQIVGLSMMDEVVARKLEEQKSMFTMLDIKDCLADDIELITSVCGDSTDSSPVEVTNYVTLDCTQDVIHTLQGIGRQNSGSTNLQPVVDCDIESLSSLNSESDECDSDSDFCVVPLPDCFNTELPCSNSTTTSVIVKKDTANKSVDEILSSSSDIATPPLTSSPACDTETTPPSGNEQSDDGSIEHRMSEINMKEQQSHIIQILEKLKELDMREVHPDRTEDPLQMKQTIEKILEAVKGRDAPTENNVYCSSLEGEVDEDDLMTDGTDETEDHNDEHDDENNDEHDDENNDEHTDKDNNDHTPPNEPAEEDDEAQQSAAQAVAALGATEKKPTSPSASAVASNITVAALGVLSQAASSAFTITKDVLNTLQAQKQYVPPKSNWKPKDDVSFTVPKSTWTPSEDPVPCDWESQQKIWSVTPNDNLPMTPMRQLIEMGFANRELNERLLKEYNNDIQKVVQDLLNETHQDWNQTRH